MTASRSPRNRPRPSGNEGKSPFRYPGGKAILLPEIYEAMANCEGPIARYAEPYAGGAGAAIQLLACEAVDRIYLNDADLRIYAAWKAMLDESYEFLERINSVELSIQTWRTMHEIVKSPQSAKNAFELGFATFFMNRTNRSGIVLGAGPIGGYGQKGKWKLDARFYRATIAKRIEWLAERREQIFVSNSDGVDFLRSFKSPAAKSTFFFIDPPYVQVGGRLYLNAMNEQKHRQLAAAIRGKPSIQNWLMTYDNHPMIHEIYGFARTEEFPIRYSLQTKGSAKEIMISPIR